MRRQALICDDDRLFRGVVGEMVAARGWRPVEAPAAKAAIVLAEVTRPDLVVLDVALAGMSGLEAAPQILAVCPEARLIFVTAFDIPMSSCTKAGAFGMIRKRELTRLEDVLDSLQGRARVEDGLDRLYHELRVTD